MINFEAKFIIYELIAELAKVRLFLQNPRSGRTATESRPYLKLANFAIGLYLCPLLLLGAYKSEAADLPRIGYAYPSGGQQETSFEIKIGGENIYGATSANISGKGAIVEIVDSQEPVNEKEKRKSRQKKKNQTVIDEVVKLKVTVSRDAEPGDRELRVITPDGVSNRLVFQISQLKEINETEPNDRKEKAVPVPILPAVVNGQIMPGDVDNFKFTAKKGQSLVIEASARALIPYIADAVPGWFQATLTLYDSKGGELAFTDDFRFNPDPVLFYDIPEDGDYTLEIRDSIYRGRADFVYRIKIGALPFITNIFPLGATRGQKTGSVKLYGKNLTEKSIIVDVNKGTPSIKRIFVRNWGLVSNSVPFAISDLPEISESEENDQQEKAQKITVPVIINGRIQSIGDKDFFCFEGKKDQDISIEVLARRLGSPLDSSIILLNAKGETLKENDDLKDRGEGMLTHKADSGLTQILPENGTYALAISDTQGKGGDEYAYRIRISQPFPDFELRAVPSNLSIQQGGSAQLTVYAIRRDGFNGEIKLSLKEDFQDILLDGSSIPEGTDKVNMTVSASEKASKEVIIPKLEGTAVINGKKVSRPVVPAEDLMQAFIYQHLVPSDEQVVAVTEPAIPFKISFEPQKKGYLELPLGKEISFNVTVIRCPGYEAPIQIQLVNPPKGITVRKGNIPLGKDTSVITLRTEAKTEPNLKENLIFNATMFVDREEKEQETVIASGEKVKEKTEIRQISDNKLNAEAKPIDSKDNTKDASKVDNDGKETKQEIKVKKFRKEKIVLTLPAVPFRIVENTEKKKTEEVKKTDDTKSNKN